MRFTCFFAKDAGIPASPSRAPGGRCRLLSSRLSENSKRSKAITKIPIPPQPNPESPPLGGRPRAERAIDSFCSSTRSHFRAHEKLDRLSRQLVDTFSLLIAPQNPPHWPVSSFAVPDERKSELRLGSLCLATADLRKQAARFRTYFHNHRTHTSVEGERRDPPVSRQVAISRSVRWQPHCRALIPHTSRHDFSKDSRRCSIGQRRQQTPNEIITCLSY